MPTPAANFRRFVACAAGADAVCCAGDDGGRTDRHAADGRELLAGAIANTRGSYLVYNFGGGNPAPMLNAGGSWYEMTNGGHLMIDQERRRRAARRDCSSTRHQGYQSRCERDARAPAPARGCGRPPRSTPRCRRGRRSASRRSRSTPTSSTCAARRAARGSDTGCSSPLGAYVDNTRGQGTRQRRRHGHPRLRGQAGAVRRRRELDGA